MPPWLLRAIVVALVMLQVPSLPSVCHAQCMGLPSAADDSYETREDTGLVVPAPGILANDTDADGEALTAELAQAPAHGRVVLNADGSFTYTPETDFQGADSFTYAASYGKICCDNASVTIRVDPVNDMPWAADHAYETKEDTELVVPAPGILANASDPDGDALTTALAQAPAHGRVVLNADGSFTYTPLPDFQGADSFTYMASDGKGGSDNASVTITVDPMDDVAGSIGVYFDAAGTRCQGTIHPGVPSMVYILAKPAGTTADGVAGAEFRFTGLPLSWHVFPVASPELIAMGDPFGDGVVAAWPQCQGSSESPVLLYSVAVVADAEEPDVVLGIGSHPSNYTFPCPLLLACDDPVFTKHCVSAQSCFVNSSTPAGPCASVLGIDQKTWSGVKELYR
jgi:VCBS repeat-containing protein